VELGHRRNTCHINSYKSECNLFNRRNKDRDLNGNECKRQHNGDEELHHHEPDAGINQCAIERSGWYTDHNHSQRNRRHSTIYIQMGRRTDHAEHHHNADRDDIIQRYRYIDEWMHWRWIRHHQHQRNATTPDLHTADHHGINNVPSGNGQHCTEYELSIHIIQLCSEWRRTEHADFISTIHNHITDTGIERGIEGNGNLYERNKVGDK
jgi:hypothetical protein